MSNQKFNNSLTQSERYYSSGDDPMYQIFRWSRIIMSGLILFATYMQIQEKNSNSLFIKYPFTYDWFLIISLVFFFLQLFIGVLFLRNKIPKHYKETPIRYLRFFLEMILCGLLLYMSNGAFEYYLLFFPGIIMVNLYFTYLRFGKLISAGSALLVSALYIWIQSSKLLHSENLLHMSSTMVKGMLLLVASYFSFWFWKNRKIGWDYIKSIEILNELNIRFTKETSLKVVLEVILEEAIRILKADIVHIAPYKLSTETFQDTPFIKGKIDEPDYSMTEIREDDVHYHIVNSRSDIFAPNAQKHFLFAHKNKFSQKTSTFPPFVIRENIKSSAGVLLTVGSEIQGVMFVNYRTHRDFREKEKKLIKLYSDYAALSIKNILEKEKLLKNINAAIKNIHNITNQPQGSSEDRENHVIQSILSEYLDLFHVKFGYYKKYDITKGELTILFASEAYKSKIGFTSSDVIGLTGKAVRTRQSQVKSRRDDKSEWVSFSKHSRQPEDEIDKDVKSAFAIPLLFKGNALGVYMIESEEELYFSELDHRILKSLITQGELAINYIRLTEFLNKLRSFDKMILENIDLENILQVILQTALNISGSERGNILLKISDSELRVVQTSEDKNINPILKVNDSISGLVFMENESIYIPHLQDSKYYSKYVNMLGAGIKTEFVVPLTIEGKSIGILNLESTREDAFSREQQEEVEAIAGQAAVAIYKAQLYEENQIKSQSISNMVDKGSLNLLKKLNDTIVHRINNSAGMTYLKLNELLEIKNFDSEGLEKMEIMKKNLEKLMNIRNELFDEITNFLSSPEEEISFEEIKTEIEKLDELFDGKDVKLEFENFDVLPSIKANRGLIVQGVFAEIIRNAIKSMTKEGKITVRGKTYIEELEIEFEDNGCGISQEDQENIFGKGYTKFPRGMGRGQGLSDIKNIIEYYSGRIDCKSEVGKGSLFTIRLPIMKKITNI